MKAAVYRAPNVVTVEEIPVPSVGPGEVLLKVLACGICGTDLKKIAHGDLPGSLVFGHEVAGRVVAVGPGVAQGAGVTEWKEGDRVTFFHHIPCRRCRYCLAKAYAQCPQYKRVGTTAGFEPAGGGFAEYLLVKDWIVREGLIRIPEGISDEEATFVEPVNTALKGLQKAGIGPAEAAAGRDDGRPDSANGQTVLILGAGPIGLILTQLARRFGSKVFVTDPIPERLQIAKALGAHEVFPAPPGSPPLTPIGSLGVDVALVAAPPPEAIQTALAAVRPAGRVVLFAQTRIGETALLDVGQIGKLEKELIGSYSASIELQEEAADLVFNRKIQLQPLITHRFRLDQIAEALRVAMNPSADSLKVIIEGGIEGGVTTGARLAADEAGLAPAGVGAGAEPAAAGAEPDAAGAEPAAAGARIALHEGAGSFDPPRSGARSLNLRRSGAGALPASTKVARVLPTSLKAARVLSASMKAVVLYGKEDVRLEEVPVPVPGPGEVLIRVKAALTCGTDLKVFRRGYHARMIRPPALFGHEFSGIIEAVGPEVEVGGPEVEVVGPEVEVVGPEVEVGGPEASGASTPPGGWQPGMRVVAANSAPCRACFFCRRDKPNLCEDLLFVNGAYAEFLRLPARVVKENLLQIPPHLSFQAAALTEPLACVVRGLEAARPQPGETVVILGAGPIGLLFTQLALKSGARVILLGKGRQRLQAAQACGAEVVFDLAELKDPVAVIREATPDSKGADLVIEAVGQPQAWVQALRLVRPGGRILLFGGCPTGTEVPLEAAKVHYEELTILSTFHHTPQAIRQALQLLAEGVIRPEPLITHRAPLNELPGILRRMREQPAALKTAILP